MRKETEIVNEDAHSESVGTPAAAVVLEVQNGVGILELNRPKAYNAFDLPMVQCLADELVALAGREDVRGLIVTGYGKAFCAGGDLRWIAGYKGQYGAAFHELAARFHQAILEIRRMPKPVIAALNGLAAGGGFSLALACDFRIMDRSAVLRQAYTSNGLSLDGGGTFTLPRIVGLARAMEVVTFDAPIDAAKALEWGLVTEVVEQGRSVARALEVMEDILSRSSSSFAASKQLLLESFGNPFEVQLEREREMLARCGDHPNGHEGVRAFLEKRKPRFQPV
ncbi:putative enoyl-CoA hydratase PaaG [uncultured Desulfatiglans sp.]|uniref:Putative enoyl-CoA hydratase PaaG n=1 Tax=Uncultured Desulfatiglans sp. TaxID=1748965 RepID=A0A653AD19_UNCDX|nr:putative enoyl-CoA hydratase PaaG [uncultured Desulfatiglans sp.]